MRKLSISAFAVVLVLTPIGASAQPRQANLPDGVGKDLVEGLCTGCHSANQIVRSSGYTEEEWAEHVSDMVDLADMPKERSEIAQYLAANMPPDTTRAANRSGRVRNQCERRAVPGIEPADVGGHPPRPIPR